MKKTHFLVIAVCLLASLCLSCSRKTDSAASDSGEAPVEVSFWFYSTYPGAEELYTQKLPAAVKARYPHITLKPEMQPYDTGPERLTVAMATGGTPDLYLDNASRILPGIHAGLVADVSGLHSEFVSDMFEGCENLGFFSGSYYTIPVMLNNGYLFTVNAGLAKELGVYELLPADKVHWSYDQFLEFCRAVRRAGRSRDIYPIQLYAGSRSSDSAYYSMLMSGGARLFNDSHTEMAVNGPETVKTLNLFKTLIDEDLVPDGAATTKDEALNAPFFAQKVILYFPGGGAQEPIIWQNQMDAGDIEPMELEIICYPTPDGKADPHVVTFGTVDIAIFKNANDPAKIAAAENVIRTLWLEYDIFSKEECFQVGLSPVKKTSMDYGVQRLNDLADLAFSWNASYSDSSFGILESWYTSWRETFYVELQEFYLSRQNAQQLLANWTTKGNEVIKSYLTN
jgi:ABC-type glycerol-3-phosphate transport system substrate-binding protein